jgi:hypothetical protein
VLRDAPVQQALAKHLPNGGQEHPRQNVLSDKHLLPAVKASNPVVVLYYRDDQQCQYAKAERYDEYREHVIIEVL